MLFCCKVSREVLRGRSSESTIVERPHRKLDAVVLLRLKEVERSAYWDEGNDFELDCQSLEKTCRTNLMGSVRAMSE